jgi:hypothetical protein
LKVYTIKLDLLTSVENIPQITQQSLFDEDIISNDPKKVNPPVFQKVVNPRVSQKIPPKVKPPVVNKVNENFI